MNDNSTGLIPAVAYLRVSTPGQAKTGTSLEGQLPRCQAIATAEGGEIIAVFSDSGVSGALYLARPDIQRALAEIESGRAKMLVFADVDRSGRDVDVVRDIAKRVYLAGAKFVLADEGVVAYDTKGKTSLTLKAMFAEWERDAIRDRTMRGRRRTAMNGKQPNRLWSPYGYHIVTKADVQLDLYPAGTDGTYVLVEEQAQIAREIYQRVYDGGSLYAVVRWLNGTGIPTPSRSSNPESKAIWYQTTVRNILRSPVYKGKPVWGKSEARTDERRLGKGHVSPYYSIPTGPETWVELSAPAIVSEEVWDAVQERLDTNKSRLGGNPGRRYLLSGLLRCPMCGGAMSGQSSLGGKPRKDGTRRRNCIYFCIAGTKGHEHREGSTCQYNSIQMMHIESLFIEMFTQRVANPEMMAAAIAAWQQVARERKNAEPVNVSRERLAQIEKQLETLRTREAATIEAQIAGIEVGADVAIYSWKLREIVNDRRSLLTEQADLLKAAGGESLAQAGAAAIPLLNAQPADVAKWLATSATMLATHLNGDALTTVQKRELIREVVLRIVPVGKDAIDIVLTPFWLGQGGPDGNGSGNNGGDASAEAIRRRLTTAAQHAPRGSKVWDTVQGIFTGYTSMSPTMAASRALAAGTIRRPRCCDRAQIAIGKMPVTGRTVPSSPSSPMKTASLAASAETCPVTTKSPTASERSKAGPALRVSAGARLTTIFLSEGNEKPLFLMAARTRSRDSCTAASGRPTIMKLGMDVLAILTSTRTP